MEFLNRDHVSERNASYSEYFRPLLVLGSYVPVVWSADRSLMPGWHWISLIAGIYLATAIGLRNLTPLSRLPVWVRTLWVGADMLIWALTRGLVTANCPIIIPGLVLCADATGIGWSFRKGRWHWLFSAALVLAAKAVHPEPSMLQAKGGAALAEDILLIAAVLVTIYALAYLTHRRSEDQLNLARAYTETERAYTAAELANNELRAYARQVEEMAVLRERNRLAREVHDTVSHAFTGILMQLEAVKLLVRSDPDRAEATLDMLLEHTSKSLGEVRRSVHALRPLEMEQHRGLPAFRSLAERFAATTGVSTDFRVAGSPVDLPVGYELSLFRAMQEGLTNAFRHGRATRVVVELAFSPEQVSLHMTNDCPDATVPSEAGLGLLGIKERAAALGGSVTAGPEPGGRFSLLLTLPFTKPEEETNA